ncbi:MAG: hypothetical protein AB1393_11780 [Candidatus Edwardsbacteria bacterium]
MMQRLLLVLILFFILLTSPLIVHAADITLSSDGYALKGMEDNTIRLYDIARDKTLKTLKGHSRSVASLVFSHGIFTTLGTYILSYNNEENVVKVWDVKDREKYPQSPFLTFWLNWLDKNKAAEMRLSDIDYEKYDSEGKYFSALTPKNWEKEEKNHPYSYMTEVYGVKLTGTENKDGALVTISILYYTGKRISAAEAYKYEDFISSQLSSPVRVNHDKEPDIVRTMIAGMQAIKLQVKTFDLVRLPMRDFPPMDRGIKYETYPPSRKVIMIEQFIAVPAAKGFYVLHYRAPEDIAREYMVVFEKVAGSFEPHLNPNYARVCIK